MSGTILDYEIFGRELGLNPDETTFINVEYSPFPEKNRPIYTRTLRVANYHERKEGWNLTRKCANAIAEIAAKYPDQEGIDSSIYRRY